VIDVKRGTAPSTADRRASAVICGLALLKSATACTQR
jgi:hypothetical protein